MTRMQQAGEHTQADTRLGADSLGELWKSSLPYFPLLAEAADI